ncbi:HEAT repeat domain-containing protein [uncultured Rubinisphaera sp.]|uniref:HEAT repeat domain-containing protein n=1 Tax=uncultured Rubinisphaera sp. TaxID=1678686 RepID=UPI0030D75E92
MNDAEQFAVELQSADVKTRQRAAEKLARLTDGAAPALISLLDAVGDMDETVREWSVEALENLGTPSREQLPDLADFLNRTKAVDPQWFALKILSRYGTEASKHFVLVTQFFSSDHPQNIRMQAIITACKVASDDKQQDLKDRLIKLTADEDSRIQHLANEELIR